MVVAKGQPMTCSLLSFAAAAVLAGRCLAQDTAPPGSRDEEPSERLVRQPSDVEARAATARFARISEEIQSLKVAPAEGPNAWGNEWAGVYRSGLWESSSIAVAPENGVQYMRVGCVGLYDQNSGRIEQVLPDRLIVKLAVDGAGYMSPQLLFIRWGDRRYLVPESRMVEFCNAHNDGSIHVPGLSDDAPLHEDDLERLHAGSPPSPSSTERSCSRSRCTPR